MNSSSQRRRVTGVVNWPLLQELLTQSRLTFHERNVYYRSDLAPHVSKIVCWESKYDPPKTPEWSFMCWEDSGTNSVRGDMNVQLIIDSHPISRKLEVIITGAIARRSS